MSSDGRNALIHRLRQGRQARERFVASHISKGISFQIRAIRDRLGWSQERLAKEVSMPQNAISRLESPDYGKPTLTTLKRLAAAFDVGLVVRFVPFSELIDWVSGTPHLNHGLSLRALSVPSFENDTEIIERMQPRVERGTSYGVPEIAYLPAANVASGLRASVYFQSPHTTMRAMYPDSIIGLQKMTEPDLAGAMPPQSGAELTPSRREINVRTENPRHLGSMAQIQCHSIGKNPNQGVDWKDNV